MEFPMMALPLMDLLPTKQDEIIDALVGHSGLRWICLEGVVAEGLLIGRTGCMALVNILCNTAHKIVSLYLKNIQLTREGPTTLARGLASNSTLNELSISDTNVEEDRTPFTEPEWHTIFSALSSSPMCRLEKLQLRCSNLKTLDISHTLLMAISGWREILQPLQTPCFRLECLILNYAGLDNNAITCLTDALVHNHNSRLKELHLEGNPNITAAGWTAFSSVLQSTYLALECINLYLDDEENPMNDDNMIFFANSQANNNKMRELLCFGTRTDNMTVAGYAAFNTYHSNHSLEKCAFIANSFFA